MLLKSLLVECCVCHGNPGFNFTCTSCSICYQATQIVEIFHIPQFFYLLICTEDGCLKILITIYFFTFISILYYLSISISLPSMPCSRVSPLALAQGCLYVSQCELLFFLFEVWCLWKLKCPHTFYWDCSCFGNAGHCLTLNGKLV